MRPIRIVPILIIIGCLELCEALFLLINPKLSKDALRFLLNLPDRKFRLVGLLPLIIGTVLMALAFLIENSSALIMSIKTALLGQ